MEGEAQGVILHGHRLMVDKVRDEVVVPREETLQQPALRGGQGRQGQEGQHRRRDQGDPQGTTITPMRFYIQSGPKHFFLDFAQAIHQFPCRHGSIPSFFR